MIQGRDLLTVVELLESVETEAAMRTQIGRFYYAVFLEVRDWCERNLGYSRVRLAREHQALDASAEFHRLKDRSLGSTDCPTKVVILTEGTGRIRSIPLGLPIQDPPAKPVKAAAQ